MKSGLFRFIVNSEQRAQQVAAGGGEVKAVTSSTTNGTDSQEANDEPKPKKKRAKNKKLNKTSIGIDAQKVTKQLVTVPTSGMESSKKPAVAANVPVENPNIEVGAMKREQIKAEREAKKLAKLAKKTKAAGNTKNDNDTASSITLCASNAHNFDVNANDAAPMPESVLTGKENFSTNTVTQMEQKKPALTKAERRAIQEAQRAAKANAQTKKPNVSKPETKRNVIQINKSPVKEQNQAPANNIVATSNDGKVKLFSHLERASQQVTLFVNNPLIHTAIARLGEQYAKRTVVGSNARCVAFLNAIKMVIQDFETPPKKEFSRSLETALKQCVKYLQECRPLAVSISNAYKHIKHVLTQLSTDKPESECKEHLCQFIDTYIENQIGKAAEAISVSMQEKIKNGDVLVTFGCSSLIYYICEQAKRRNVDFRVIVVDARPFCEGVEMLRRLTTKEISCSYVLINAVGFIMPEATKVLLGAHALLSNGYVMARTGTAQVALVARSYNVPVLVCCETHKFSERFQTDAIVYNELGDPEDLVRDSKCSLNNWQCKDKMTPLNLMYDITPPELVTAVVTDVSILPCTSVPVILRIKPAEIGYFG